MEKVIRIWDGPKVVQVLSIDQNGGSSTLGAVGGAGNSTLVDIEIDPWQGYLVDHSAPHVGVVTYQDVPE
jgi:hypothetical protein